MAILWDIKDAGHPRRLGDSLVPHGTLGSVTAEFAPSTDIAATDPAAAARHGPDRRRLRRLPPGVLGRG
ncbi:hypothetical protein [Lentzea sp. NPDC004782]|uniref:hypothetical protein n=1 Tax=Lentzea sp. NPDC004782 TaxID=3154458 RepID=UPI0033B57164